VARRSSGAVLKLANTNISYGRNSQFKYIPHKADRWYIYIWYSTLRLDLGGDKGTWTRYAMTAGKIRAGSNSSNLPTVAARCSMGFLTKEGFWLLQRLSGREVLPLLACLSGLTSSRASSSVTTPSSGNLEAAKIGVWPSLSDLFGLTSSSVSSSLLTTSCPPHGALQSGV